jgi:hypothetical protein
MCVLSGKIHNKNKQIVMEREKVSHKKPRDTVSLIKIHIKEENSLNIVWDCGTVVEV